MSTRLLFLMRTRICLQTARTVKNALRFCNDSVNRRGPADILGSRALSRPEPTSSNGCSGVCIEKRWTTPDQYPLSINALRLACNQSTNRDPVTRYTEDQVSQAGQRLSKYGLARLASGHTTRATKYRHLAEEGLALDRDQLALLCVLLLRGPQTPGELKQRSERLVAVRADPGRRRARAVGADRARLRHRPRSPAGPEGGPLGAAAGGRGVVAGGEFVWSRPDGLP